MHHGEGPGDEGLKPRFTYRSTAVDVLVEGSIRRIRTLEDSLAGLICPSVRPSHGDKGDFILLLQSHFRTSIGRTSRI